MMSSSSAYSFEQRPVDYEYHWRGDQDLPEQDAVLALAAEHDVDLTSWAQVTAATLGRDGSYSVERETAFGTTYTTEYTQLLKGATFFSESDWNTLTVRRWTCAPAPAPTCWTTRGAAATAPAGTWRCSPTW